MDDKEIPVKQEKTDSPSREYLEYMLKGVQAFAVGVALLGASVAVANSILPLMTSGGLIWVNFLLFICLMLITIAISVFGCLGVLVGLIILEFWQPKGSVPIITWGIYVGWFIFEFVFVGHLSTIYPTFPK